MTLPYGPPPDGATVVRQSIINKMQNCPASYGYRNTEGYLDALGESLTVGDGLHWCAAMHTQGIDPQLIFETFDEWCETKLTTDYDWSIAQIPNYGELRQEILDAYRLWVFQIYLPNIENTGSKQVETTLYMPLAEDIWLEGTPDLVINGDRIWDWKTAKSDRQWNQQKADYALQSTLYLALHNANTGEGLSKFTFAVYNRQKAEWSHLTTLRDRQQMDAALLTAVEYGKQIRAEAYPATPVVSEFMKRKRGWYCSARWCPAWNVCEHKFMNDKTDESEVAVRIWR